ncbi:MAG: mechanosensitive ion channel family protein [Candidatus Gracilibacteria bacterium]|nr:mechanosensitive ion channel family protein [Candidatus Gracilibacteria bacterium]
MKKLQYLFYIFITFIFFSPQELGAVDFKESGKNVGETVVGNTNYLIELFSPENFVKVIMAVTVVVVIFFLSKIISNKIVGYIERNANDGDDRAELSGVISRTVHMTFILIGFSITLGILGIDIAIFMGGIGFGIGFTLKTFLTNFVSGIMMVTQGYYHNGDIIEIDGSMGTIRKINALFTAVEKFDGVIFYMPNIRFIEDKVTNYYANDKRRSEIEVLIDYKADVRKAKETILMILEQFPNILNAPGTDIMVDSLGDNGILLRARYWTPNTDDFYETKSNITETINVAFKKQDIEIAYPHLNITHTNLPGGVV